VPLRSASLTEEKNKETPCPDQPTSSGTESNKVPQIGKQFGNLPAISASAAAHNLFICPTEPKQQQHLSAVMIEVHPNDV